MAKPKRPPGPSSEFARWVGSHSSERKAASSRENGKKGGRWIACPSCGERLDKIEENIYKCKNCDQRWKRVTRLVKVL